MVKNLPALWETWVQSLGWEDPLEEGMATHSSILAWRIPMDRGAWWVVAHGDHKELDMTERLSTQHISLPFFCPVSLSFVSCMYNFIFLFLQSENICLKTVLFSSFIIFTVIRLEMQ